MASVKWTRDALQDLDAIDRVIARRIIGKVAWFEENFDDIVPEKLHRDLRGFYKLRVGDYRVVYSLQGGLMTIEAVGHRRTVYKV